MIKLKTIAMYCAVSGLFGCATTPKNEACYEACKNEAEAISTSIIRGEKGPFAKTSDEMSDAKHGLYRKIIYQYPDASGKYEVYGSFIDEGDKKHTYTKTIRPYNKPIKVEQVRE